MLVFGIVFVSDMFKESQEAYAETDFYIYGVQDVSHSKVVLYTSDGSSGNWTKSNTKDGTYEPIGTEGHSLDLGSTDNDGWYKCNNSPAIRVMKKSQDSSYVYWFGGRPTFSPDNYFEIGWAFCGEDELTAYCITQDDYSTCLYAFGSYTVPDKVNPSYDDTWSGQTVWFSTSVASGWEIYGSTVAHPEQIANSSERSATFNYKAAVKARINEDGVTFYVTLGEGIKALSIRGDAGIGSSNITKPLFDSFDPDYASSNAVLNTDASLKYIYSIGAPDGALDELKAIAPAFAISSREDVDILALGNSEGTSPYIMNVPDPADPFYEYYIGYYTLGAFKNQEGVVLGTAGGGIDLRVCTSWVDRQPGDVISFTINAGPASQISQFKSPSEKVEELIDEIGTVEYTEASKAKIDEAREAYDELNDHEKGLVSNFATLEEAETTYAEKEAEANQDSGSGDQVPDEGTTPAPDQKDETQPQKKVNAGAIVGITIGAIVAIACCAYILLFFAFNKFIIKDNKVVRAFVLGKKDEDIKLITFKCAKEVREKEKVFATYKEAKDYLDKEANA